MMKRDRRKDRRKCGKDRRKKKEGMVKEEMLKERKITKKKTNVKKRKERIYKEKEDNSEMVKTYWREVRKIREEGSKEYSRYR